MVFGDNSPLVSSGVLRDISGLEFFEGFRVQGLAFKGVGGI